MFRKFLLGTVLAAGITPFCGAMMFSIDGMHERVYSRMQRDGVIPMPPRELLECMFRYHHLDHFMGTTHIVDQLAQHKTMPCAEIQKIGTSALIAYVSRLGDDKIAFAVMFTTLANFRKFLSELCPNMM